MAYTVKKGDTLWGIARANGMTLDQLLALNPNLAANPNKIGTGISVNVAAPAAPAAAAAAAPDAAQTQSQFNSVLAGDPQYNAFLRSVGFNESEIESSLQAIKDAYQRDITRKTPIFEDQRMQAEKASNRDFESRGLFRSGARIQDIGDKQKQVGLNEEQYRAGIQEDTLSAERDAAAKVAALRRQTGEQQLSAAERLTGEAASAKYGL